LHFFEATAQFGCAVLISILRAVPDLFEDVKSDIATAAHERPLFERADFGLWINLGYTLAKAIRRLTGNFDKRGRLSAAAEPAGELMARLADKAVWRELDRARKKIRNPRTHTGVVNQELIDTWLQSLEDILSPLERALGDGFEEIDLIRADEGRLRAGVHMYRRAQRLRGPSDVFEEFELRTRLPIDSEHLAFVSRDLTTSSVLEMTPLVRLGSSPSNRNASYFFNSHLEGDTFLYVSYHFQEQPRIEIVDHELGELAKEFE